VEQKKLLQDFFCLGFAPKRGKTLFFLLSVTNPPKILANFLTGGEVELNRKTVTHLRDTVIF